uniref:SsDNA binding protein n=1 Tax=uncultured marine virus TaxID=186617 RepID=A0A0F7LC18_9VIRU|nr:ssDNA binding protein [uncultured marine virus]
MTKDFIAKTGRVKSWQEDPEARLPVSCTVFVVEDSMEGTDGIESSLRFVSHALRNGAGVSVHLSKLRAAGSSNGKGLVASGPVSFGKIYSVLNEVLRRGGVYKNGAVVLHLDLNHPDALEFVNATRAELPWVKKCLDVTPEWWNEASKELQVAILNKIQAGDIWLNKVKYNQEGERIYGNVCLEIYLPSRGTCLLSHINLGQCDVDDLSKAFLQGMSDLCSLHPQTGVGDTGEYLDPSEDRQVGLGLLGLANFLRIHGVSYAAFGEALRNLHDYDQDWTPAICLATELRSAIAGAANVARAAGMDRAFTIAPTASCSYNYTDLDGFTTTPEIAPPISRDVDRDSGTFGVQSYHYGEVEVASEVEWEDYKAVADGICGLFEETGLFHGYSFNSWSDVVTYDNAFIEDWFNSPQTSLYYALQVTQGTQRKDDAAAILDDDYADIFDFDCPSCAE